MFLLRINFFKKKVINTNGVEFQSIDRLINGRAAHR